MGREIKQPLYIGTVGYYDKDGELKTHSFTYPLHIRVLRYIKYRIAVYLEKEDKRIRRKVYANLLKSIWDE